MYTPISTSPRRTLSLPYAGAASRHHSTRAPAAAGALSGHELRRLVAEMLD